MAFGNTKLKTTREIVDEPVVSVAWAAAGFALASIVAAVLVTPLVQEGSDRFASSAPLIDHTSTGSITRSREGLDRETLPAFRPGEGSYVIRRSILNKNPSAPCIIREGDDPTKSC